MLCRKRSCCGRSRDGSFRGPEDCESSDGVPLDAEAAGLRVIYYWAVADEVCLMLYLYAKNEQGDLTPSQTRELVRLVREEFR